MSVKVAVETNLIERWLESNPHKPGEADWRIKDTGLPVWRVVGQFAVETGSDDATGYRAMIGETLPPELIERVATYYDVPIEAMAAALAYARRHPDAVVARLVLDRAALSG